MDIKETALLEKRFMLSVRHSSASYVKMFIRLYLSNVKMVVILSNFY